MWSLRSLRVLVVSSGLLASLAVVGCEGLGEPADPVDEDGPVDENDPPDDDGGSDDNGESSDCGPVTSAQISGGAELDGCYEAAETLTISEGTLVLEPGTVIRFPEDEGLDIKDAGRLKAEGTEDEPIRLTGVEESRGFWAGVRFKGSNSSENVFDHVVLEYAGSTNWGGSDSTAGLFVRDDSQLTISNSTFRENAVVGILVRDGGMIEVSGSEFVSNKLPLKITPANIGGLQADNSFSGNDTSRIATDFQKVVDEDATWRPQGIPYEVRNDITIRANVTVEPGAEFLVEENEGVEVLEGGLTAEGAEDDKIRFTGIEETKGHWMGINYANPSSDNVLSHAIVEYGGSGGWAASDSDGNIYVDGSDEGGSLEVSDTAIRYSGTWGINIDNEGELTGCEGLSFKGNENGPFRLGDRDGDTPPCRQQ